MPRRTSLFSSSFASSLLAASMVLRIRLLSLIESELSSTRTTSIGPAEVTVLLEDMVEPRAENTT